jgi:DNA-binding Xre family transcriptional regulator
MKSKIRDRRLTPEEVSKYKRLRELADAEKPEIVEMARQYEARRRKVAALISELKAHRAAKGMSLADVRERSGIDRSALSRLENGSPDNPTLETLLRYADAVECQLVIQPKE